jgi:hypothetical protein
MPMKHFLVLFMLLFATSSASALEIGGVELPESLEVGGGKLILNGGGLRTKTFLKIKVYAGGLYLIGKESDSSKIIDTDRPMAIRMVFIYDGVSPEQLIDGWNEGFETASGGKVSSWREQIDRFNSFFTGEAKRGDVYDLIYTPGKGVEVIIKGELRGTIPGMEFKKILFAIWLGDDPCDEGLKEGMLGK